jgi:hypothetical protein
MKRNSQPSWDREYTSSSSEIAPECLNAWNPASAIIAALSVQYTGNGGKKEIPSASHRSAKA